MTHSLEGARKRRRSEIIGLLAQCVKSADDARARKRMAETIAAGCDGAARQKWLEASARWAEVADALDALAVKG